MIGIMPDVVKKEKNASVGVEKGITSAGPIEASDQGSLRHPQNDVPSAQSKESRGTVQISF